MRIMLAPAGGGTSLAVVARLRRATTAIPTPATASSAPAGRTGRWSGAPGCRGRLIGPGRPSWCRSAERRQHRQRHQRRAAAADAADRDRPIGWRAAAAPPRCGAHSLPARAPSQPAGHGGPAAEAPAPLQPRPGFGEHDPAGRLPAGRLVDLLPDLDPVDSARCRNWRARSRPVPPRPRSARSSSARRAGHGPRNGPASGERPRPPSATPRCAGHAGRRSAAMICRPRLTCR